MRLPTLAASLQTLAAEGPEPFYSGEIARRIAVVVQAAGGVLQVDDLAAHRSEWVESISVDYYGARIWECPPNGQGLAALLALNALRHLELTRTQQPVLDAQRYHFMIESMRQAFADAATCIADPQHADVPVGELLRDSYAAARASQLEPAAGASRGHRWQRRRLCRHRYGLLLRGRSRGQRLFDGQQQLSGLRYGHRSGGMRLYPTESGRGLLPRPHSPQRPRPAQTAVSHHHPRHGDRSGGRPARYLRCDGG